MTPDVERLPGSTSRCSKWLPGFFWLGAGAVLVLAAWLWSTQTRTGAPFVYHPDEPPIMARAIAMVHEQDLDPRWFRYPTLYFYIQAVGVAVLHAFGGPPLAPGAEILFEGAKPGALPYYVMGRWISIAFGLGTALLVILIARRVAGRAWALFGGMLFVTSGLALRSATTVTVDMPLTFFVAAATYLTMRAADPCAREPSVWRLALIVVAGSLAAGAKYNGALVLVPFAAVVLVRRSWTRRAFAEVSGYAVLSMVLFVCTTPYAVLDVERFWSYENGFLAELEHYSTGHMGADQGSSALKAMVVLLSQLTPLAFLGLASMTFTGRTHYPLSERAQVGVLLGVATVMAIPVCLARVFFDRNCLVFAPHVIALTCLGLSMLARAVRATAFSRNVKVATIAALFVTAGAFHANAARDRMIGPTLATKHREDPRTTAYRWTEEHLPAGANVLREAFSPHVHLIDKLNVTNVFSVGDIPLEQIESQYDYVFTTNALSAVHPRPEQTYEPLRERQPLAVWSGSEDSEASWVEVRLDRVDKNPPRTPSTAAEVR